MVDGGQPGGGDQSGVPPGGASPPPPGGPPPYPPSGPGPGFGGPPAWAPVPAVQPIDRVRMAAARRQETDYIFNYWSALGWTLLSLGFFGYYVFYQLVRRMGDHNRRRHELFDAALTLGWDEAGRRGLADELRPSFERAATHMAVLQGLQGEFRDPAIWTVLAFVARGIAELIAFILLDGDLVKHDRSEVGVEYELSLIYGRLGQPVPPPDQNRVKQPDNYVGRVFATVGSFGFYGFWWYYNQMDVVNRHFEANWFQEDILVAAAEAVVAGR